MESPKVTKVKWGCITVSGQPHHFKDVKLYPGGARSWDWEETGTRHRPGVQPADVEELVEKGCSMVIVSTGMAGALQVKPETITYLEGNGIDVHILPTKPAVDLYNHYSGSCAVGALIHSTC